MGETKTNYAEDDFLIAQALAMGKKGGQPRKMVLVCIEAVKTWVADWMLTEISTMPLTQNLTIQFGWHYPADAVAAWGKALEYWEGRRGIRKERKRG